jgi:hypothetical protein
LRAYGDLASTPAGPVPVQALLAQARAIAPHGADDFEHGLARLCSAYFERQIVDAEDAVRVRRAIGPHAAPMHAQVSVYLGALMRAAARPPLPQEPFLRGLATAALLFNVGLYFEVHEVLELIWRKAAGDLRTVVQGLLQTAVALHHARAGNLRSAWTLLRKGTEKLRRSSNPVPSLDIAALLAALAPWEEHLARVAGGDGTRADAGAPNGSLPASPRLRLPPYEP